MNRPLKILTVIFIVLLVGFIIKIRLDKAKVAGVQTKVDETAVRGIILPHHKLAEELILESFEKLSGNDYSYVVIFGPNHFEPEVGSVVTAKDIFDYSFNSEKLSEILAKFPDILVSSDITGKEHSITLHLPYIKHYFPNAEVLPFIISPYASKSDLYNKINFLTQNLPPNTLYIASVDFAHNTLEDEAMKNNEESIKAIENHDYTTILGFTDDHMDSPLSISLLIKSMENIGATKWETWQSSHGAILKKDPLLQGTSYVIGVFK